jgi:hypothetical protein
VVQPEPSDQAPIEVRCDTPTVGLSRKYVVASHTSRAMFLRDPQRPLPLERSRPSSFTPSQFSRGNDMGCGCNNGPVQSWYDIFQLDPVNPLDLVANAELNNVAGAYANSTNYLSPGTWVASPAQIQQDPTVTSLATDQTATVAAAQQWNFQHQSADILTTLAPPLRKILFLKAGTSWENNIQITLSGGGTYDQFYLSFRDNAGTRGDSQGAVPVIAWTGLALAGTVTLDVVLRKVGQAVMGLVMHNNTSGDWSMFEMEWIIVP